MDKNTLKVCFLTESFFPIMHGVTRQAMMLGERLSKRGMNVIVITRRSNKSFPKEDKMHGYHIYRVPPAITKRRYGKYFMIIPTFYALLRRSREYDIIIVSDFKALGIIAVVAAKILRKKCILRGASCGEMDGTYAFAFDDSPAFLKKYFVKSLIFSRNIILRQTDKFLSISSAITKELKASGIEDNKIFEMHNGVDTELFTPVSASQKLNLRSKLHLPDSFIFIYSGRIAKGKGLFTLMNVWKKLVGEYENIHLLLIGSSQGLTMGCEAEIKHNITMWNIDSKVFFTGHVENVYEYLQASDCFVFPTEYEALSNTLLEATSCGLPCIATKVGGNVDVIEHNDNGLLFEANNEEQLHTLMKHMMKDENKRKRLGQQARIKAVNEFNIDGKLIILENVIRSMVQKTR